MRILPGVRQNPDGSLYRVNADTGRQVPYVPELEKHYRECEPVIVRSKVYPNKEYRSVRLFHPEIP